MTEEGKEQVRYTCPAGHSWTRPLCTTVTIRCPRCFDTFDAVDGVDITSLAPSRPYLPTDASALLDELERLLAEDPRVTEGPPSSQGKTYRKDGEPLGWIDRKKVEVSANLFLYLHAAKANLGLK